MQNAKFWYPYGMKLINVFFIAIFLFSAPLALAQSEDPGILPNSPFYFLKEWVRAIEKIFTFTSLGKSELALEIAESKILELKRLKRLFRIILTRLATAWINILKMPNI